MKQLFDVTERKIPQNLRDKFLTPPLSILDAKSGYWTIRKRDWENILKDVSNNVRNITARSNTPYINQFTKPDFIGMKSPNAGNISTFDPFLCEILIKWFSKPEMVIYDPFAGGIVRGAVAGILGREYLGVDICNDQVTHNYTQWSELLNRYSDIKKPNVSWINDDAEFYEPPFQADMMLTCPPYYNLEVYTDNPEDLSNKNSYEEFLNKFTNIIGRCYNILKEDSFAVIVVEEIRDPNGIMYGFVADTINIFRQCGFKYYNELILENKVVSTAIRCSKYFVRSRKVGRHHQNVLIFYKGNVRNIEGKFGGEDL